MFRESRSIRGIFAALGLVAASAGDAMRVFAENFANPRRGFLPPAGRSSGGSSPMYRSRARMSVAQQKRSAIKRRNRLRHKARIQRKKA